MHFIKSSLLVDGGGIAFHLHAALDKVVDVHLTCKEGGIGTLRYNTARAEGKFWERHSTRLRGMGQLLNNIAQEANAFLTKKSRGDGPFSFVHPHQRCV